MTDPPLATSAFRRLPVEAVPKEVYMNNFPCNLTGNGTISGPLRLAVLFALLSCLFPPGAHATPPLPPENTPGETLRQNDVDTPRDYFRALERSLEQADEGRQKRLAGISGLWKTSRLVSRIYGKAGYEEPPLLEDDNQEALFYYALIELELAAGANGQARAKHVETARNIVKSEGFVPKDYSPEESWAATLYRGLRNAQLNPALVPLIAECSVEALKEDMRCPDAQEILTIILVSLVAGDDRIPQEILTAFTQDELSKIRDFLLDHAGNLSMEVLREGKYLLITGDRFSGRALEAIEPLFEKYKGNYIKSAAFWKNWGVTRLGLVQTENVRFPYDAEKETYFTECAEKFKKSLELSPNDLDVIFLLGLALQNTAEESDEEHPAKKLADEKYKQVLALSSDHLPSLEKITHNLWLRCVDEEEDVDFATVTPLVKEFGESCKKLQKLDPASELAAFGQGYLYFKQACQLILDEDTAKAKKGRDFLDQALAFFKKADEYSSKEIILAHSPQWWDYIPKAQALKGVITPENEQDSLLNKPWQPLFGAQSRTLWISKLNNHLYHLVPEDKQHGLMRYFLKHMPLAAKETPDEPYTWFLWGRLLEDTSRNEGDHGKAREYLREAVRHFGTAREKESSEKKKRTTLAFQAIARLYLAERCAREEREQELRQCIKDFNTSLDEKSSNYQAMGLFAWAHYYLAKMQLEAGDKVEAATNLRLAEIIAMRAHLTHVRFNSSHNCWGYLMACIRQLSGHGEQARPWLETAEKEEVIPGSSFLTAQIFPDIAGQTWFKEMVERVKERERAEAAQ